MYYHACFFAVGIQILVMIKVFRIIFPLMSEMIVQCLVLITGERVEEEEDEDMEVVNGT